MLYKSTTVAIVIFGQQAGWQWSSCIVFYLWSRILLLFSRPAHRRKVPLLSSTSTQKAAWQYFWFLIAQSTNIYWIPILCQTLVLDFRDTVMEVQCIPAWSSDSRGRNGEFPWDWSCYLLRRALGAEREGVPRDRGVGAHLREGATLKIPTVGHLRASRS